MRVINILIIYGTIVQLIQAQYANFPPCIAFDTLKSDTIKLINSYSNVLYVGIDNAIEVDTIKLGWNPSKIKFSHGTFFEDELVYYIIPLKAEPITVYLFKNASDTLATLNKKLQVEPLPKPYITIGRINLHNTNLISKSLIIKEKSLEVHISPYIVDDSKWFKITDFTFGFLKGRMYMTKYNEGAKFSNETLDIINILTFGSEFSLNVKVSSGDGNIIKSMPLIKLRLVE